MLLDEYFEAIVGDFGLAKLLDHQESHVTTAVRGTVGHIAPEYLSTGQSSEKTDVFGFGVLLVELITGQKALDFGRVANQKGGVLDWVSGHLVVYYSDLHIWFKNLTKKKYTFASIHSLALPFSSVLQSFFCYFRLICLHLHEHISSYSCLVPG